MRVRFPSLLVPRRRRPAADAPRENIGGWREVAPLTVTVSLRPHVTVGPPLGEAVRPLAGRGLAVPARLSLAMCRPASGRLTDPTTKRPPRPVPSVPRLDRAPEPEPAWEHDADPDESWTDDDSIAELRAILATARRQAAEAGAPVPAEWWQAAEPAATAEPAVVTRSWPEPGSPVRLPWEHDDDPDTAEPQRFQPPARVQESPTHGQPVVPAHTHRPVGSATPGRSRPADTPAEAPTPVRPRRLSLAESRRRGITGHPPAASRNDEPPAPTVETRPTLQDTPADPIDDEAAEPVPQEAEEPTEGVAVEPVDDIAAPAPERPADVPLDTPPAPPADVPLHVSPSVPADAPADRSPTTPADRSLDVPADPSPSAPAEPLRVSGSGRQVVTPRGPAVGRLPDGIVHAAPPVITPTASSAPRTPPADPPVPPGPPTGSSATAGSAAHVRPTAARRVPVEQPVERPHEPRVRPVVRPPDDPRPRLGLGEPLNRAPARPWEPPVVQRPEDEPVGVPSIEWVVDGAVAALPVHTVRDVVPPLATVGERPDVGGDGDPVALPPRPRQVVTPNRPARQLGLGAPLTTRPTRDRLPDLPDVTVHRGPAVNEQARAWQARAFTRDGEIYLPDAPDHRDEQATLTHELIHVVQQRTLGDALPPEWTAAGRALEQEAAAVAPPEPVRQPPPPVAPQQHQHQQPDPFLVPLGVQRDPDVMTMTFPQLPHDVPAEPPEPPPDELAEYREQLIALCDTRTVDLDDRRSIDELATKLYPPLRGLLRAELIVDRERAGLLTDFR